MNLTFVKMQAAGNDYIYLDNLDGSLILDFKSLARDLSRRSFSVGGDGLVIISPSKIADCKMIMYNADGSRGKTCGNALRCVGKYFSRKFSVKNVDIETDVGVKEVFIDGDFVRAEMGRAIFDYEHKIEDFYNYESLRVLKTALFYGFVDVGNPHFCVCVKDLKCWDFGLIAPLFAKNKVYGEVNVELFSYKNRDIECRVLERGSGETLSCGTGALAVSALSVLKGGVSLGEISVKMRGGDLKVFCDGAYNLTLGGKVEAIYRGEIYDRD